MRVYNPLEGPTLCMGKGSFLTPFLYYLFAFDDSHTCLRCALHMGLVFIEVYTCLYNPIMWIFYHFDPGERLRVCELIVVPSFGWYYPFGVRNIQFESPWFNAFVITIVLTLML